MGDASAAAAAAASATGGAGDDGGEDTPLFVYGTLMNDKVSDLWALERFFLSQGERRAIACIGTTLSMHSGACLPACLPACIHRRVGPVPTT